MVKNIEVLGPLAFVSSILISEIEDSSSLGKVSNPPSVNGFLIVLHSFAFWGTYFSAITSVTSLILASIIGTSAHIFFPLTYFSLAVGSYLVHDVVETFVADYMDILTKMDGSYDASLSENVRKAYISCYEVPRFLLYLSFGAVLSYQIHNLVAFKRQKRVESEVIAKSTSVVKYSRSPRVKGHNRVVHKSRPR